MFSRRAVLAWMFAGRPKLAFTKEVANSVVFRRAYTACTDDGLTPMLTGRYPHGGDAQPLTRLFDVVETIDDRTIVVAAGAPAGRGWDEHSARIPLSIRFPGMLEGGITSDALISTVDVMPTILSLLGMEIPAEVHGRVVTLSAPPPLVCSEGMLRQTGEWRMIVRGYDKMVTNAKLQPTHLFNLADDPDEANNLASEPGHRLRADELRALLQDWRKRTGDGVDPSGLKRRK